MVLRVVIFSVMVLGLAPDMVGADTVRPKMRPQPLALAISAVRAKDWANAEALAKRVGGVSADIVDWLRLRAGDGSVAEAIVFRDRRSDWPGLALLATSYLYWNFTEDSPDGDYTSLRRNGNAQAQG